MCTATETVIRRIAGCTQEVIYSYLNGKNETTETGMGFYARMGHGSSGKSYDA